jgi:hypothetical protein
MPISIETPELNYRGDGRCIYCLMSFTDDALTVEHIVPRSLNGKWHFHKAACRSCQADCNRAFEAPALATDFLVPRLLLGLRRRNRKEERHLPPVFIGDATTSPVERSMLFRLEAQQYPGLFSLMHFETAGKLRNAQSGNMPSMFRFQIVSLDPTGRASGVTTTAVLNPKAFGLTLAKIAYCFACAKHGLDGFVGHEMRDLLCGRRDDVFNFVGQTEEKSTPFSRRWLHALYLRERRHFVTVIVHLFSSCGASPYEVVVGTAVPGCR